MPAHALVMDFRGRTRFGPEQQWDHFVVLDGVKWSDYERLLDIRGERSAPRMTYLDGTLEIMSPSFDHEKIASLIGCLIEAWCIDHDVDFLPAGSWTIKKRTQKSGAEADECYIFGERRTTPTKPDLAIEVIWTSGGLDKLDVYRKLGVPEVWIWDKGRISVHRLRGDAYVRAARSQFVPDLDIALMAKFLDRPSATRAIRDFRAAVAGKQSTTRPKRRTTR